MKDKCKAAVPSSLVPKSSFLALALKNCNERKHPKLSNCLTEMPFELSFLDTKKDQNYIKNID